MSEFRASNLFRRKLCPGSLAQERGLPDLKSEWADEGTLLHKIMAEIRPDRTIQIAETYSEIVKRTMDLRQEVIERVVTAEDLEGETCDDSFEEEVYILEGKIEVTGHIDFSCLWENEGKALIIDYKFGRIPAEQAEINIQLRAYAVMLAERYGLETVYCAIIQPRLSRDESLTISRYTADDIDASRNEILNIVKNSQSPDAKLNPSLEACRYCKAKSSCPAAMQIVPFVMEEKKLLSPEDKSRRLDLFELAEKLIEAERLQYRQELVENPEAIPGWHLKDGATAREIEDPLEAFNKLKHTLNEYEFTDCCKVSVSKLEAKIKEAKDCTAKQAKDALNNILGETIKLKQREASLKRVK